MSWKEDLREKGYAVVPGRLHERGGRGVQGTVYAWQKNIPSGAHQTHGIYKYYEVGHQRHSWLVRLNPKVQGVFRAIWETKAPRHRI